MKTAVAAAEPPERPTGAATPDVTIIYPGGADQPTTGNVGVYADVMVTLQHRRAVRGGAG